MKMMIRSVILFAVAAGVVLAEAPPKKQTEKECLAQWSLTAPPKDYKSCLAWRAEMDEKMDESWLYTEVAIQKAIQDGASAPNGNADIVKRIRQYCSKVNRDTEDKKASDFTIRDTKHIQACHKLGFEN